MFPSQRRLTAAADKARKEAKERKTLSEDKRAQEEAARALEISALEEAREAEKASRGATPRPEVPGNLGGERAPEEVPVPGNEDEDRSLRKRMLLDAQRKLRPVAAR